MVMLCNLQSSLDQINVGSSRSDAVWRLLLKCVKDVTHLGKSDGINDPITIALMVFDQFEDSRALTLPGFGRGMPTAELR